MIIKSVNQLKERSWRRDVKVESEGGQKKATKSMINKSREIDSRFRVYMVIGGVRRQRTFGHLIISGCYRDSRDMWKSLPAFSIGINTPAKNQMALIQHVPRWIAKEQTQRDAKRRKETEKEN